MKASRRGRVPPFIVMDVMRDAAALEAAGRKIIHLEVGQPSTGIPRVAAARLAPLIERDALGYTVADGTMVLRERIARHYFETYGATVAPSQIFVTTGSSAGFLLSFLSAFDAGERVALAAPGYPAYRHILSSLDVEPVLIPTGADTRFQVSVAHLDAMRQDRGGLPDGLIVASPANPTGTMIPEDEFRSLVAYCHEHDIRLISDEIYHGITFGPRAVTAAGLSPSVIVINSFSKYFSMTGWRVGWAVVPDDLYRSMECLAQNHFISPPTLSQWGALYAFDGMEELNANVERYARNRLTLLEALPKLGFADLAPADGAFYIYADISRFKEDAATFCRRVLHDAGVAITPGIDFDPYRGDKFVRFSFAVSEKDVAEALVRLGELGLPSNRD
ncbi:MAG: aminotransferase class I/II-fold pyridoxal phosphate-dependent enzyme [Rhodobacteraceae bacterium]|nr:aminotransferase class I/II-fold pyridoxal phosphate-dependent enzyme [Paracoccaceae bacterium]